MSFTSGVGFDTLTLHLLIEGLRNIIKGITTATQDLAIDFSFASMTDKKNFLIYDIFELRKFKTNKKGTWLFTDIVS
ncbi:hypothetical protein D3C72_1693820 [compost metagenome]